MDRCRCEQYREAVRKLRLYTVGTYRPDIIDNFDRSGYHVSWVKNGVGYEDLRMEKPRVMKLLPGNESLQNKLPKNARKIEQMWCPYMTPYKLKN